MSTAALGATRATAAPSAAASPVLSRPRFALLVLAAVYPLVTTLLYLLRPLTAGWSVWQQTIILVPIMVGAMVWGVIPAVQKYGRRFILVRRG